MAPSRFQSTCPCVSHTRRKDITRNRHATFSGLVGISLPALRSVKCSGRSVHELDPVSPSTPVDILIACRRLVLDAVVGGRKFPSYSSD